jgi:polysaccharide pyruvyl transferase WcaK-like protein
MMDMKSKVGIVTIYGNANFGNKLQNYAVEYLLKTKGCQVCTIRYIAAPTNSWLKNVILSFIENMPNKREKKFRAFSDEYLTASDKKVHLNKYKYVKELKKYSAICVGSDQVWNYECMNEIMLKYFLVYGVKGVRKIALAPSIATAHIKDKDTRELFQQALQDFYSLSCRESENIEQLEQITNRKVSHLMDPTLAVPVSEWYRLIRHLELVTPERYCFQYFLGDSGKKYMSDMEVVDILNKNGKYYESGPLEFLYYIANAEIVVTDSFHAVCFALLFGKPFIVFNRDRRMNARITTIIQKFKSCLVDAPNGGYTVDSEAASDMFRTIQKEWDDYLNDAFYNS